MASKSDTQLIKYAKQIVFLSEIDGELKKCHMLVPAYDAEFLGALRNRDLLFATQKKNVDVSELKEIGRMETTHGYRAPIFFKPTIEEILQQIPAALLDRASAIAIRPHTPYAPEAFTADGNKHRADVTIYEGQVKERQNQRKDWKDMEPMIHKDPQGILMIRE